MTNQNDRAPTLEEIKLTIAMLVADGLVEDSGERRNGRVLWKLTSRGQMLAACGEGQKAN